MYQIYITFSNLSSDVSEFRVRPDYFINTVSVTLKWHNCEEVRDIEMKQVACWTD